MKILEKYLCFTLNAVKELYTYRFRMLIWLISDFTFLFVEYFLWKAIFDANNGVLYDFTLKQYITYVAMGLIVARITACRLDFDVAGEIKDGSIVMNLIKPFNYAGMWFSRHVGWFIGGSATLIPVMIVIALLIGFNSVTMPVAAAFVLSLIFGFIISFFFTMIMGMLAFWLTNIWGLLLFKGNLIAIFSGQMIAISLFFKIGESGIENFPLPFVSQEFIQGLFKTLGYLSYMLPFQAMTYTPTAIYTGMISGNSVILHLLLQVFWVIFMGLLVKFTWERASKKITIMGG